MARSLNIFALDAGHGACTLIIVRDDENTCCVLVDCGTLVQGIPGGSLRLRSLVNTAREIVRQEANDRVDHLVVTHLDYDHIGGINSFIGHLKNTGGELGVVYTGVDPKDPTKYHESFHKPLINKSAEGLFEITHNTRQTLATGSRWEISIAAPTPGAMIQAVSGARPSNEVSAVVHVRYGDRDVLVCGDAPATTLLDIKDNGDLKHVALLIAPHHGGKIGTPEETLDAYEAIEPDAVLFSAGEETALCSKHVSAVESNSYSLMCTGGVGGCGVPDHCAGDVRARLSLKGFLDLSPDVDYHRNKVRGYPDRQCAVINPDLP